MRNFNHRFNGIDHDAWEFEYDGITCLCYKVEQHGTSWWVANIRQGYLYNGFGKTVWTAAKEAFQRYRNHISEKGHYHQ